MGFFGSDKNEVRCHACGGYVNSLAPNGTCLSCGAVIDEELYNEVTLKENRARLIQNARDAVPEEVKNYLDLEHIANYGDVCRLYIDWATNIIYLGRIDLYSVPVVGLTPWLSKAGNPIVLDTEKGIFIDRVTRGCPF